MLSTLALSSSQGLSAWALRSLKKRLSSSTSSKSHWCCLILTSILLPILLTGLTTLLINLWLSGVLMKLLCITSCIGTSSHPFVEGLSPRRFSAWSIIVTRPAVDPGEGRDFQIENHTRLEFGPFFRECTV